MAENYGLKVHLELLVKNLKEIEKKVKDKLKKVDIEAKLKKTEEVASSMESAGGGAKGGKKGGGVMGVLGGIFKRLAPLAILLSMKPIMDLVGIGINILMWGILKVIKWIPDIIDWVKKAVDWIIALPAKIWDFMVSLPGRIWDWIKLGFDWIREKLVDLKNNFLEWISALPGRIWEFLKSLPGLIWGFLKEIPGKIWEWIKVGFEWVREKLVSLWGYMKEKLPWLEKITDWVKKLWGAFVDKILDLRDKIKEKIDALKNKLSPIIEKLIETAKEKWNMIIGVLNPILTAINKVIDWVKNVADKIGNWFGGGGGGGGVQETAISSNVEQGDDGIWRRKSNVEFVKDAIITKSGKIVKTDPNDTIFATKNPGGNNTYNFNFYGLTAPEIVEMIKRELAFDININAGRF